MVKRLPPRNVEPSATDRQILRSLGTPKKSQWTDELSIKGPGTHAARPAATAVQKDSLYYCTDHQKVYISDGSAWSDWLSPGGAAYATVQEEGVDLTQRSKINFVGAAVTAVDDAANGRTNVTVTAPTTFLAHVTTTDASGDFVDVWTDEGNHLYAEESL